MAESETTPLDMSPTIGALAAALAKAQGLMDHATLDGAAVIASDKGRYQYQYASLASVLEAIRQPLSSNGLAITQIVGCQNGGLMGSQSLLEVTTILMHASGEWVRSTLAMRPTQNTPQGQGSAITYARRYALAAIVGIAADTDDDAAEASRPAAGPSKALPQSAGVQARAKSDQSPARAVPESPPGEPVEKDLTPTQFWTAARAAGYPGPEQVYEALAVGNADRIRQMGYRVALKKLDAAKRQAQDSEAEAKEDHV